MEQERKVEIIPKQLKEAKFCRVKLKEKRPFETDWPNKPYTYDEISKYFPQENYGVLTGVEIKEGVKLGIIDDDTPDKRLLNLLNEKLGHTFRVKSHYYAGFKNWDGRKMVFFDKDGTHLGELQGKGAHCVGAGSTHPSGEIYEVVEDIPIIELDFKLFQDLFQDYIEKPEVKVVSNSPKSEWKGDDIKNIPIPSIISLNGLKDMGHGCFQGSHPKHGSEKTGMNFRVDTINNTYYCFRCGRGGGPAELIAVMEGIIDCKQAGPQCFSKEQGQEVIKLAREKYGLEAPEINNVFEEIKAAQEDKFTPLKQIDYIPMEEIRTKIIIDDISPGKAITCGYAVKCTHCGIEFISTNKQQEYCNCSSDKVRYPLEYKEGVKTGCLCEGLDPEDSGPAPQYTNIFFPNEIIPKERSEKLKFELDMQIKPMIIEGIIWPLDNKNKIKDWFIEVTGFKFAERKYEVNKALLHKFGDIKRDKMFFQDNFIPKVLGRELDKKIHALTLVSPLKIPLPNKEIDYGTFSSILAGDAGQSKTALTSEMIDKYCGGIKTAQLIPVENATNRGLIGAVIKNNRGYTVRFGVYTMCNGGLAGLDGFGKLNPDDLAQIRGIMEERKFQIVKAGKTKREASIRTIAISNIRKSVREYINKHKASMDIAASKTDIEDKFVNPQDRRRFSHISIIADEDIENPDVFEHQSKEIKDNNNAYWDNLREFAWGLQPDKIKWEEGLNTKAKAILKEWWNAYKDYSDFYGIFSKGAYKQFITQLPAVAILHESIDEDFNVIVKEEHVDWLKDTYESEFKMLGLDIDKELADYYDAHARAIIDALPWGTVKILAIIREYGSQTKAEDAGMLNKMDAWRKFKEPIKYSLPLLENGKILTHNFEYNLIEGDWDANIPGLSKAKGGITDFGRVILKKAYNRYLKERIRYNLLKTNEKEAE